MAFRDFWHRDQHRDERQRARSQPDPSSRDSWRDDTEARYDERTHQAYSPDDESRRFNDRWQNSYTGESSQHDSNYGGSSDNPFYGDHPLSRAGSAYDSPYFGANGLPATPWQPEPSHYERNELVYGIGPEREVEHRWRGQFRGVGPRGYRRSDERIKEDVCQCLTDDHHIDASNIEVAVNDREVVLSGTVQTRAEKRHAEDLIERLPGVRDVINGLRVVIDTQATRTPQSTDSEHLRHSGTWR